MARYSADDINSKEEELVSAFIKSIKEEDSEKETILAAKGLSWYAT